MPTVAEAASKSAATIGTTGFARSAKTRALKATMTLTVKTGIIASGSLALLVAL